ncbi:hypothetical protein H4S08_003432 [Coemansia sp. RSA 1365]|nr:hypothetical protein H4S08_003432 [Coemansia sp. RSA 1365]
MSPGTLVETMGSRSTHIDALLVKQGRADKLLLRRRVEFRLATQADAKMDLLRKKYKPINSNSAGSRTGKANGASSEQLDASASAQNGHGLDESSGFRRAAHSLFPAEQLAAGWQTMRPIGPGLSNLGNTCFLNSVLQCLTYTPPLAEHMLTREHSAGCRVGESCMLCRFEAHVVRALSKREGSSISPKAIVGRLKIVAKHMRVGRQEDAHEFLRLLVDAFQRSLLTGIDPKVDRRVQETTLAHQVFGGYLQSQVSCGRCGYDSNTFDPLLDISLDIQGGSTIEKALRSFTRPETLTTSNRYRCEKCNKLVDATKQMTIYQLPRILTLQLKRFSVFGGGKIGRYVEFPLNLNMKSYVSRNSPERASYDYSLYAVLVHAGGTSRSGHYYCFVKSPAGVWYELNDSTVHQVSERTVLKQSAYMLFYQRCAAGGTKQPIDLFGKQSNQKRQQQAEPNLQIKKTVPTSTNGQSTARSSVLAASDEMEALLGSQSPQPQTKSAKKRKAKRNNLKGEKRRQNSGETTPVSSVSGTSTPMVSLDQTSPQSAFAVPVLERAMSMQQTPSKPFTPTAQQPAFVATSGPSEWIIRDKSAVSDTSTKSSKASPSKISKSGTSAVPVIAWDDATASKRTKTSAIIETKRANSWSVSDVRTDPTLQYGARVESWTGGISTNSVSAGATNGKAKKRQRRPDAYDAEYDRGRIKKVKKNKHRPFESNINPFQAVSDKGRSK